MANRLLLFAFLFACAAAIAQTPASPPGPVALQSPRCARRCRQSHRDDPVTSRGSTASPRPLMAGLQEPRPPVQRAVRTSLVRTHDMMGPARTSTPVSSKSIIIWLAWLIPNASHNAGIMQSGARTKASSSPNPNADPENPASYNFGPTDTVIAQPSMPPAPRSTTASAAAGAPTRPARPPTLTSSPIVVKHVAMHYNQGWDHGFHYRHQVLGVLERARRSPGSQRIRSQQF